MMGLQQIAERCQQGDREAFALLYTAMREPLRTLCLSFVKNEAVADDLLHDAFLLIFSKIGELKDTSCTEAWMKTVTRRVALLYLRQRHQQVPLSASPELTTFAVENNAEPSLVLQDVLAAVDDLPEGYRRVFRMSVFEGMSHQEIANLLHIEPHSSSSQLFHAKVLLRRWLRPLALLLLAVALPLSVYIWKQNDEKEISKTVETDKQKLAATEKPNQESEAKQETTAYPFVRRVRISSPSRANFQRKPIQQRVLHSLSRRTQRKQYLFLSPNVRVGSFPLPSLRVRFPLPKIPLLPLPPPAAGTSLWPIVASGIVKTCNCLTLMPRLILWFMTP